VGRGDVLTKTLSAERLSPKECGIADNPKGRAIIKVGLNPTRAYTSSIGI